ncbi:histidine phosphatase superfamily [Ilyonectria robusta]|uniref:histidine phosphatase superfamily n=1 Tax=Ilyonectria robusta TaxID=1079257 RepID=UPI001E8D82AB|nr:histidine phosphatase superfamily [Ilyonectria robusta]KAH6998533.1 histidine phosphatase superfamily [Ilyonectria sp. MPI-CAGE-AT-0026]KAH8737751.1 histidine phosphatase superfamily [Ilyonectria robusta]
MPLEVIYVTRHGFRSTWSVDPSTGIYSASIPSPTGIPADPALTSHGVAQAKQMGTHLMTLDPPVDVVYSSPYYRCLETITPFVELKKQQLENAPAGTDATAATIRPEYGLCEFFGAAPFNHPIPASPEKLKAFFPSYDDTYASALAPSRKGEGIDDLYRRVAGAMQSIIDRCDAEGKRAVVLCTHAAVVIALGRVLTGRIPDSVETKDFHAYTCGLSVYRRQGAQGSVTTERASGMSAADAEDMGNWECELDSDCSFLSSGEERGWMFSGDESFAGTGSMSQEPDAKL